MRDEALTMHGTPKSASLGVEEVFDLRTLVMRAGQFWPSKIAIRFDETGDVVTYGELDKRSRAVGQALLQSRVGPGDRVAVMLPNGADFPVVWLGITRIGAIMVPLNTYYRAPELSYILEHATPRLTITADAFVPMLLKAQGNVRGSLISIDGDGNGSARSMRDFLAGARTDLGEPLVLPENAANIQYTSGTTGRPKGCVLSHRYWLDLVKTLVRTMPHLQHDDVLLTSQPFYYIDPQWNVAATLLSGAELVVLDRFHPSTFWSKVREHNVTFFYCLGMMPTLLLKSAPSDLDRVHRVRLISSSAIPVHLHQALEERWGVRWHEVFGMTETGADIFVNEAEHDELIGTGCIGRTHIHREARVVNDGGIVPRGEVGELVLRGTGLMDGYYKDPEATAQAFRDGWFHTGDLVRMDESGRIYYVGRLKEVIRRSGENISATEVEDVIKLHPAVRMVACIAVPDEIRGEEIKAYLVLQPDSTESETTPQDFVKFCTERLAYFKVPRYWSFRDELPVTPSERVAKNALREELRDLTAGGTFDAFDGIWR